MQETGRKDQIKPEFTKMVFFLKTKQNREMTNQSKTPAVGLSIGYWQFFLIGVISTYQTKSLFLKN